MNVLQVLSRPRLPHSTRKWSDLSPTDREAWRAQAFDLLVTKGASVEETCQALVTAFGKGVDYKQAARIRSGGPIFGSYSPRKHRKVIPTLRLAISSVYKFMVNDGIRSITILASGETRVIREEEVFSVVDKK